MTRDRCVGPAVGLALLACLLASQGWAQEATRSPHGALKEECSTCHAPEGWTPARISRAFDHTKNGFALTGAHASTTCRACHASLAFSDADPACVSCHEDLHRGELGTVCSSCHTTRSFVDRAAMTRGHQLTRFPLDGAHLVTDCRSCHVAQAQGQMVFLAVPNDCVSCHQSAYQSASNPNHLTGGFPTTCSQCHGTVAWNPARFNHDGSGFPLTGAHRAVTCDQCHVGNNFTGAATQCVACHQNDYNQTSQPNHAQAAFPTDCVSCHTTASWTAPFNHSRTQFPLAGAHKAATCQQCHNDGIYIGKSTQCVSCHLADYNATTNPAHQGAGFPTDCASCHNTTRWPGATFAHDGPFFPIYSGSHRGTWSSCSTCHQVASDFHQFTCLVCHEHNQPSMDSKHHGRAGYSYVSTACLSCHPNGRGED